MNVHLANFPPLSSTRAIAGRVGAGVEDPGGASREYMFTEPRGQSGVRRTGQA